MFALRERGSLVLGERTTSPEQAQGLLLSQGGEFWGTRDAPESRNGLYRGVRAWKLSQKPSIVSNLTANVAFRKSDAL